MIRRLAKSAKLSRYGVLHEETSQLPVGLGENEVLRRALKVVSPEFYAHRTVLAARNFQLLERDALGVRVGSELLAIRKDDGLALGRDSQLVQSLRDVFRQFIEYGGLLGVSLGLRVGRTLAVDEFRCELLWIPGYRVSRLLCHAKRLI